MMGANFSTSKEYSLQYKYDLFILQYLESFEFDWNVYNSFRC